MNMGRAGPLWVNLLFSHLAAGFPHFKNLIPNGDTVFVNGKRWSSVGHSFPEKLYHCLGDFRLNQFGIDFRESGFQWSRSLCLMDSDSDGRTNGEELGDPDCLFGTEFWSPAGTPVGHPGWFDEPRELHCVVDNESTCLLNDTAIPRPIPRAVPSYDRNAMSEFCTTGSAYVRGREPLPTHGMDGDPTDTGNKKMVCD